MFSFTQKKSVVLGLFALLAAISASTGWLSGTISTLAQSSGQTPEVTIVAQTDTEFIRTVTLSTNDVVYNQFDQKLYVSQPSVISSGAGTGNSITAVNPRTGQIASSVFIGSEPTKLALGADNGQTLYAYLDGSYSIRRLDTVSQTAGAQFSLGYNSSGRFKAGDMAVSPDNPNILAVARNFPFVSPLEGGVAIFDNGTQLPQTGPAYSDGSDFLAFSNSGSTLYGAGLYSGLKTMTVSGAGVTVTNSASVGSGQIKFAGGKIFTSGGQVVNPATGTILGTFSGAGTSAFVPDATVGRAYYLVRDPNNSANWILKAFDIETFTPVGSLSITNVAGDVSSLVRWGVNGLAFRTTANKLYLVQTVLIPSAEPIPTPTTAGTPTATPTPTPFNTYIKTLPLYSKNVIYSPATQKLYASVPSAMGANGGNTVATINPANGTIESKVFVGSEPNKLALSSDSQTLYVGLDGSRAIRKFDTATQMAGQQFGVGTDNGDGPLAIVDFDSAPDNPNVVVVSRCSTVSFPCYAGDAIFENGVKRPEVRGSSYSVAFSGTGSVFYGSGSYGGTLETMTVLPGGVTGYSEFPFGGGNEIKFVNNLIYTSRGQVVNPATQSIVGTFALGDAVSSNPPFAVDTLNNKIFFVAQSQIRAFDLTTFLPVGSIDIPNIFTPTDLKRWGANGLAVSTGTGPTILIQTALVNPSEPVPVSAPTPTPTPTPTAEIFPTFTRRVNLPVNDIVFNQNDNTLYTTVASLAGAGVGNTITRVNPQTGQTISSVFVGSEPNKIALSNDGQTIYTSLNGSNSVRRYDVSTQTPNLQFANQNESGYLIQDLAIAPDSPNLLVVSSGNGGVGIYDNGVKRSNVPLEGGVHPIRVGPVEFSNSPDVLYAYNNNDTGFDLFKVGVDANGLNLTNSIGNLISGFGMDMKYVGGKIYTSTGRVIDPETQTLLGTFPMDTSGNSVAVDTNLGRIFIVSTATVTAYDINTFTKIGSFNFPNFGTPTNLVRWGTNGLAFRVVVSSTESYLNIIQSKLVSPDAPLPTGISTNSELLSIPESSPTVSVAVTRSGESSGTTTVNYATADETAIAGQDYTAVGGTLTFAPGETSKFISIPIINDTIYEGGVSETFSLSLSNPTGADAHLLFPNSTTISIFDNEQFPRISSQNTTVNEVSNGNTSIANVTVRLNNSSVQPVSVNYATANGTAIAGADYQATSGTLTFAPNESVKTIPVTIYGDSNFESNETFTVNLTNPVNGNILIPQATVTIVNYAVLSQRPNFDFDGDGKTDISIFRPASGEWWYLRSSNNSNYAAQFGTSTDKSTPADFTGDGKTDIAFWRPSTGEWFILRSEDGSYYSYPFGINGDIPAIGDFDGDGKADSAVFRPSDTNWYIRRSTDGGTTIQQFGASGDVPAVADYDGDGKSDIAIWRASTGEWWIQKSSNSSVVAFQFGNSADKPVQGDYTGDGKADVAIWRPSTGEWFILRSEDFSYYSFPFGTTGDVPAPGDYDGDGRFDATVFRPSNSTWYMQRSTAGTLLQNFGQNGDKPVPNAFVP
jgi:sugar lactone lactonase YvrE